MQRSENAWRQKLLCTDSTTDSTSSSGITRAHARRRAAGRRAASPGQVAGGRGGGRWGGRSWKICVSCSALHDQAGAAVTAAQRPASPRMRKHRYTPLVERGGARAHRRRCRFGRSRRERRSALRSRTIDATEAATRRALRTLAARSGSSTQRLESSAPPPPSRNIQWRHASAAPPLARSPRQQHALQRRRRLARSPHPRRRRHLIWVGWLLSPRITVRVGACLLLRAGSVLARRRTD